MLKVLDVDGAVRRVRGGWLATGEPWHYDAARLRRVAQARTAEQQAMREYVSTTGCRMEFLRRCLDDPEAVPCGRCDRCADARYDTDVSAPALAAAQAFLGRPGVDIMPKKLWPTGLEAVGVPLRARSPPASRHCPAGPSGGSPTSAGVGDCGPWSHRRPPTRPSPTTSPGRWSRCSRHGRTVPTPGRPARSRWSRSAPAAGPSWCAAWPSGSPTVGRLPLLGEVPAQARASGGAGPRGNSAQRVRALHDTFVVPPPLADALAELTGPVLLVDDLVDSGWTMTMVTRLLRQAGAPAVLPLALALAG